MTLCSIASPLSSVEQLNNCSTFGFIIASPSLPVKYFSQKISIFFARLFCLYIQKRKAVVSEETRHAKSRQKRKNFRLFINFGEKRTKADITKGFYALSFHNGGFSGKLRFHGEILHKTHLTDNVFFGILMLFSGVFPHYSYRKGINSHGRTPSTRKRTDFLFFRFLTDRAEVRLSQYRAVLSAQCRLSLLRKGTGYFSPARDPNGILPDFL